MEKGGGGGGEGGGDGEGGMGRKDKGASESFPCVVCILRCAGISLNNLISDGHVYNIIVSHL